MGTMETGIEDMNIRVCGRCGTTAHAIKVGKVTTEPEGWTELSLTGKPVRNVRLCPGCTSRVVRLVWG